MDARPAAALVVALGIAWPAMAGTAAGQEAVLAVVAGDTLPRAARIREGTTRYLLYAERDGGIRPESFLTRTVRLGEHEGAEVVWLIDRYDIAGRTGADTTALLSRTLAPVFYHSVSADGDEYLDFAPQRVTGWVERTGAIPRVIDLYLEAPVYAASSMTEVLQALPLAPGFERRLWFFHARHGEVEVVARVTGTERIDVPGETGVETWVVEIDAGENPTTMWLRRSGAEALRIRAPMPDGGWFWHVRLQGGAAPGEIARGE